MKNTKTRPNKLTSLSLEELYAMRITPSVETEIRSRLDFSKVSADYCLKICKLKDKYLSSIRLLQSEVDVLIVQDCEVLPEEWNPTSGKKSFDPKPNDIRRLVENICAKAGMAGLSVAIVNLLKAPLCIEDLPASKKPTQTILNKWLPYLQSEIDRCHPKVIISLNTSVTKALGFKAFNNNANRGEFYEKDGYFTVITLHPKALTMIRQNSSGKLWGSDYYDVVLRDFKKAAMLARGELKTFNLLDRIDFYRQNHIFCARSLGDVQSISTTLSTLPTGSVISFDTETTSLDPFLDTAKILTIQFGWRDPETKEIKACVIPLWHRENKFYDPNAAWGIVSKILISDRPKVGHNSKFDILYIYWTCGIRVKNVAFDTLLILHAIDSGSQGCYGLKGAAWDYLPELGISGYEDLLPGLSRPKKVKAEESSDEAEEPDEDQEDGLVREPTEIYSDLSRTE